MDFKAFKPVSMTKKLIQVGTLSNVRKVAVVTLVIESVTNHKTVFNFKTDMINGAIGFQSGGFKK